MSKICVLMGGRSLEREVSLKSGRRVSDALVDLGYDVVELDISEELVSSLRKEDPDLVYIALHGKFGEDGTIQSLLDILGYSYTGPGFLSCSLGFDKSISKEIFNLKGVPTPEHFCLSSVSFSEMGGAETLKNIYEKLGFPLIIKPCSQGSALGVRIVSSPSDIGKGIIGALGYDDKIIIEKYVEGVEVAVSIIGNEDVEVLPSVEIVPKKEFFDFESRYTHGMTDYFVPARIDTDASESLIRFSKLAHASIGCENVSRVDAIIDRKGVPYVLEVNVSPGMTDTSLLPMAAEGAGYSFKSLIDKLVKLAFEKGR